MKAKANGSLSNAENEPVTPIRVRHGVPSNGVAPEVATAPAGATALSYVDAPALNPTAYSNASAKQPALRVVT